MLTNLTLLHINGLPIAENLLYQIQYYPDRIEFKSRTTSITLERNKITDMCIKTDVEIQKQLAYIGFDATNNYSVGKIVKEFKELNTNSGIQIKL